jgi:hypothetical protein
MLDEPGAIEAAAYLAEGAISTVNLAEGSEQDCSGWPFPREVLGDGRESDYRGP